MEESTNIITCCNVLAGSECALKGDCVSPLECHNYYNCNYHHLHLDSAARWFSEECILRSTPSSSSFSAPIFARPSPGLMEFQTSWTQLRST